jgi:hypothetical protein
VKTTIYVTPLGVDKIAVSLPGIEQIRGMLVDNPSGSWLQIFPSRDFVPPYVLGYARSFPSGHASIDIRFTNGPAGQVSTLQGEAPTVIIDSNPVGVSEGSPSGAPFVQDFTPVLSSFRVVATTTVATTTTLLAAIANKRFRLLTFALAANTGAFPFISHGQSRVKWRLLAGTNSSTDGILSGSLGPNDELSREFVSGLDVPINTPINLYHAADFASRTLTVTLSYQVI